MYKWRRQAPASSLHTQYSCTTISPASWWFLGCFFSNGTAEHDHFSPWTTSSRRPREKNQGKSAATVGNASGTRENSFLRSSRPGHNKCANLVDFEQKRETTFKDLILQLEKLPTFRGHFGSSPSRAPGLGFSPGVPRDPPADRAIPASLHVCPHLRQRARQGRAAKLLPTPQ